LARSIDHADERYATIVKDMQQIARANLIFGLHVHVGIPDRQEGIDLMNQARYFLPHLYALSTNSPFWLGENTGLKAYRQMIFERFPRTGIPDAFESLSEYDDYLALLVATGCIDNAKKIWWDIRLHPFFNTIEFRICDAQTRRGRHHCARGDDAGDRLQVAKLCGKTLPSGCISAGCWMRIAGARRATGIDGQLIDFGQKRAVETRSLIHEILEFIAPEVDELGSHREMAHIERILVGRHRRGSAAGGLGTHARSEGGGRSHRGRDVRRTADSRSGVMAASPLRARAEHLWDEPFRLLFPLGALLLCWP
jgi:carboxylate-amine ligase